MRVVSGVYFTAAGELLSRNISYPVKQARVYSGLFYLMLNLMVLLSTLNYSSAWRLNSAKDIY